MNQDTLDAISYGLLDEQEKQAVKNTIDKGFAPEKIEEILRKKDFDYLAPSKIANYVGATRYIVTHIQGEKEKSK